MVLPRKSPRLSAERRGYKAGRFTYCEEGIKRDALLTAQAGPSQELSPSARRDNATALKVA